jgi:AcrR family transcriptional regulator
MNKKEDLRVVRTKKALTEAFLKLLEQKPLDDITVNELCDTAGVRRATFYKHYSDKFAFLAYYTASLRDQFDYVIWRQENQFAPTKEYFVEYAKQVILYINNNYTAVQNIVHSDLFPSALSIIVSQNYKDTCQRLSESEKNGMKLNASVEVTSAMCVGGIFVSIFAWLYEGRKLDPDALADEVGGIVSKMLDNPERR